MAENKKSFIAYVDWINTFEELEDEEAGKLVKHLFRYVNDLNPTTEDKLTKMCFIPIKMALKRDLVKYNNYIEKQSVNGAKGGRPKNPKNPTLSKETQTNPTKPKKADSVSVSDSVNDREEKKEVKIKYAEFVLLTETEYNKLLEEHKIDNLKLFIKILDNYKGANGKQYKSDYRAILNWVIDKTKKENTYKCKTPLSI